MLNVNVEAVGQCNLRCPSCPNQHRFSSEERPERSLLSPDILRSILAKLQAQTEIGFVALYNWGEPTLHPELVKLLNIVHEFNARPILSSNLNTQVDLERIMDANPTIFNVSTSGFTQHVYGVAHRGGDIEYVKKRMVELSELNKKYDGRTNLVTLYHLYSYNIMEALEMRRFSESLGFHFHAYWAGWGALERTLPFMLGNFRDDDEAGFGFSRMAVHSDDFRNLRNNPKKENCFEQTGKLNIDQLGNVNLCCNTYSKPYIVGDVFSKSIEELQQIKQSHALCIKCKAFGFTGYGFEFTERVMHNLRNNYIALSKLFFSSSPTDVPMLRFRMDTGRPLIQLSIPAFISIPTDHKIGINFEGSETVYYLTMEAWENGSGNVSHALNMALLKLLTQNEGEAHAVVVGPGGENRLTFRQPLAFDRNDALKLLAAYTTV